MRIFENANYPFVQNRKKAYVFSGVLLLLSLVSLVTRGLELGIDFKGGMEFIVSGATEPGATAIREALTPVLGAEPEVKTYGEDILIRVAAEGDINEVQRQIVETIRQRFPETQPEVVQTNIVGPRFAEDLKRGAIYSILGSLLVIFVYILIRFEWRFSLGAVVALFHDVLITLGLFSFLHGWLPFSLEIDQTIIAAFLTIVGYSLNDTVIVFDRIREYTNLFKTKPFEEVVNLSVNATLSRTIITSGTTLLVVVILFIFGGEVLRGFSFALIVGIVIGTYSSIFVASPVVIELRARASVRRLATAR
ncbi:protein translocase subunit SecF [Rhodothermus marinus]|uniref:protein translocase subunit SecF n=1 Tax=Rhodothermus marinus TaxID=29549 RepID=UPI0012BA4787|nr:protein translocase subunit SecF [Rhodothermus marinus]BBM69770.1 protein-export membrane protein SecF [Rhodothermus marinus]BBM72756.1 protein-export membrane protein SecF [Rhodothermus marinus]